MEILTLQRRLVEVGRIRLGAKKTSQNGKSYPAKLGQFRLTSRDRQRLDAAALLYGGEVKKWESQWELFTESDALDIAVVPGQALSSAYELWGQKTTRSGKKTAVICLRRCDGQTEMLSDEPCLCAQEEGDPQCKPTTRLSVVLTKVPGLGVWRCETHGYNAAMELAGSVQLLEALVQSGRPVKARLRLDKREQKTETETRQFVVPVLDIDHTLGQVMESIGAGPPAVDGGFTPVPALPAGPSLSVAEQVANVGVEQRPRRSNAAEPIRSTGRRPRPASEVSDGVVATAPSAGAGEGTTTNPPTVDPSPAPPTGNATQRAVELSWAQRIAITCREVCDHIGGGDHDEWRHHFIEAFSGGRTSSAKDITDINEIEQLRQVLRQVQDGEIVLVEFEGTWQLQMVVVPPATGTPVDWADQIERTPRVGETRLINRARRIANDLGAEQPPAGNTLAVLDGLDPRVTDQLLAYLEEQRG